MQIFALALVFASTHSIAELYEAENMIKAVEAVIEPGGVVRLLESVKLKASHRAIVTILDDLPEEENTALLSEASLSEDWLKPEEDEAWEHLQKGNRTDRQITADL